jgi:phosphate transport system substrate-binding protein
VHTVPHSIRPILRHGRAVTVLLAAGLSAAALGWAPAGASVRAAAGGSLSAKTTSTPAETLTGVGSSSVSLLYNKVFYDYSALNKNVSVNYSPSGSGPGVTAIEQNTASFGQSEIPMTVAQLAASKGAVLQVPTDLGGIAISYNEPCISKSSPLHLNGAELTKIYLRQITNWHQLASSCPTSANIVPVFRSDTSGPGYDLDQYLIDTSPAWVKATGVSVASTTWPNAGRASGDSGEQLNSGVATYIQQTQGSIGYVEYAHALAAKFTNAALLNKSGAYVAPTVTTIRAAGAASAGLSATKFNIVNGPGHTTYPLANFSWALIYQKQPSTDLGIVLGKLFQWVTTTGQKSSAALGYAPLPANAVALTHSTLLGLETASGQAIFTK